MMIDLTLSGLNIQQTPPHPGMEQTKEMISHWTTDAVQCK
jgi:hypothetical protein